MFSRFAHVRLFPQKATYTRALRTISNSAHTTEKTAYYAAGIAAVATAAFVAGKNQQLFSADCSASPTVDRLAQLEAKVANLEKPVIEAAGKKNSAFVFVKPHAVTNPTISLVKRKLAEAGITITREGSIDHSTIDKQMLIDNHYGAIANRAVKQKPSDLVVPEKGQKSFEKTFGISWADALAQGKVYNAADACTKLGIDGSGLEKKWGKLERNVNLIKFGGGFYAGLVDGIFVINGFYMSMRSAYVSPPASIHYFTVEWPASELTWEDFRGKVLGATDPNEAAAGSARRSIMEQWQELGLKGKPNVGDNGVHASASPFEALAERMNWLGDDVESDFYGAGMIFSGVPKDVLLSWTSDPAVSFEGKQQSLFDLLEDLDAAPCLEKAAAIHQSSL